ncbi:MAG: hypothetical protein KGL39_03925 [Patescibacteria group bacterium]|nr:hypothetical protein [Patescibacteria group bacterium]
MTVISDIRRAEMQAALRDAMADEGSNWNAAVDAVLELLPEQRQLPETCPDNVRIAIQGHSKATAAQVQLMWDALRREGYAATDELDRQIIQGAKRWAANWDDAQLKQAGDDTREFVANIRKAIQRDTPVRFIPATWQVWALAEDGTSRLIETTMDEATARAIKAKTKAAWIVCWPSYELKEVELQRPSLIASNAA